MKKLSVLLVATGMWLIMAEGAFAIPKYNPATGHWYDLVSDGPTGDWYVAESNAVLLGGHLVTINDVAENIWVSGQFGLTYWIGFNDAATEGTWKWISGEPVSYTFWGSGEPNDSGVGEDWAVMGWAGGFWNDVYTPWPSGNIDGIAEWETSSVAAVPEPGTLLLFGSCLAGLVAFRKRFALK
ncbi:MAG: PEP-CTERM sorting domain-containing protein [Candidatus Rokubacteria bacterium]|nr:PEP-CTERM sorting domain-containing protein [Candidatus Rokubacteria bacterium]MBI3104701.1 PEP-CTERM sorting domain-containing protein [Candidatus Rokubacteria bacterium]